ncbi:MAG: hypothetical protein A2149_06160 [Candidatus Schekmanbacteria bacterium RBG_16_38_11]|uniref:Cell division protein FtsX n=1 Tax=Candidatus Schekmanbacteria bacterium RBG_16_38_11 TaxID=1817880 RepID=A0A1F7RQP4_9BACT|nr:MAG: hypothetical protein A2149_06160 [Candidatus Schekmanbacteria bacterium RBG_16_38_11]
MLYRNLSFFLIEALKNLKGNVYLHLTIILIISISFFIFGTVFIFNTNVERILGSISKELSLVVFLKDDVASGSEDFLKLKKFLLNYPAVKVVHYTSRLDAYLDFKKNFKGYEKVVEEIEDNPFPSSFEVSIKEDYSNKKELADLISILSKWKSVEDLSLSKDWVNHFFSFISLIRMVIWLLVALIGTGLILIIYNGIKLTIHSKGSQIEIMKLVGGTNWFIRGQFIFEGIIEGLLGSGMSLLVLYLAYNLMFQKITGAFYFVFPQQAFSFLSVNDTLLLIGSGTVLGLLGGILSTTKYLKN